MIFFKNKNRARIILAMLLVIFLTSVVHGDTGPTDENRPIDEMPQEKSWFTKALEKTNGEALEDVLNATSGLINQWVFQTPKLIGYKWIVSLWWLTYMPAIILIVIGGGYSLLKVITGSEGHKRIFSAFLISFIAASLSLYGGDWIIEMTNTAFSSIAQSTLEAKYREADSSILTQENTGGDIGFSSFTGVGLMKIAFGADLSKNEPFYKTFTENGGGGLFVMLWAMGVMGLTGVFGIIRYFVVGGLGGLCCLWIAGSAYTGNMEPAVGLLNLYVRSVMITLITTLAWLFSVYAAESEDFARIIPQIIACILFTVGIALAIWIWFRWLIQAVKDPVTLGGKAFMKGLKTIGEHLDKGGESIRNRMGLNQGETSSQQESTEASKHSGGFEDTEHLSASRKSKIEELLQEVSQTEMNIKQISKGQAYGKDQVAKENLLQYAFRNERDLENIYQDISKALPEVSVEKVQLEHQKGLIFDEDYSTQVGDIIKSYEQKNRYYDSPEGDFYYLDKELGRLVKDKQPPEEGAYMGPLPV
ncbi:hypothetical protein [Geosporobacter ferrireducens]|uniref:hypothetical protein n=1 Tax=Geosporobacter ferrireducens TaxID=1424294 RepID=UPI00139ECFA5|nr:hypothetical protein [Geosporobacter ferrireducens]MTI53806.1 hypothetical protein [Geosporobacter ferrireducens]